MEGSHQRGYFCTHVQETVLDGLYLPGGDERFIALHIDDHIVGPACSLDYLPVGFLYAVCSAFVVRGCHHDLSAKSNNGIIDAVVVGGHYSHRHQRRNLLIDTLNNGFSTQLSEGFSGETGARITSGNNSNGFHIGCLICSDFFDSLDLLDCTAGGIEFKS